MHRDVETWTVRAPRRGADLAIDALHMLISRARPTVAALFATQEDAHATGAGGAVAAAGAKAKSALKMLARKLGE